MSSYQLFSVQGSAFANVNHNLIWKYRGYKFPDYFTITLPFING